MASDKGQLIWLVAGALIGAIAISLVFTLNNRLQPAPIFISPAAPTVSPPPTQTPRLARVYVSGEVKRPAVYELPPDGIVRDAVDAAGGFTDTAGREAVNLALPVADGMHVHVPAAGETSSVPAVSVGAEAEQGLPGDRVNINTATLAELDRLPGIGPAIGQRIIDYRQANGPFSTVEELLNVAGIGPSKLEQFKELVYIE